MGLGKTYTLEDPEDVKKTSDRSWSDILTNAYIHNNCAFLLGNYAIKGFKKLFGE